MDVMELVPAMRAKETAIMIISAVVSSSVETPTASILLAMPTFGMLLTTTVVTSMCVWVVMTAVALGTHVQQERETVIVRMVVLGT